MRRSKLLNSEMIFVSLVFLFINHSSTLSIGSASDSKNLSRRDVTSDFYPDWVPFKNKHGAELGEFVAVIKKKPKKRLALPSNFVLRAQTDQDGEDFYDKGQDDTGDDYYEKKEWSSAPKSENIESDPAKIAEIDGIVDIIRNSKEKVAPLKEEETPYDENEEKDKQETVKVQDSDDETDSDSKYDSKDINKEETEDDEKTETESTDKVSEDQSESEARKAKILDSVDELKERHAKEQRQISEQVKEEEMFKEELEKDRYRDSRDFDKYNNKIPPKWRRGNADYEEYDDKILDVSNKYKIVRQKSKKRQPEKKTPRTSPGPLTSDTEKPIIEKISVFTNPQAYVISDYEDNEETTTTQSTAKPKTSRDKGSKKFSSRYVEPSSKKDSSERIYLEPQENDFKEGEPTLFFPKKKGGRRSKSKNIKTTPKPQPDSYESESIQEPEHKEPSYRTPKSVTQYVTLYDTEPTEKGNEKISIGNEATASESNPSVVDTVPSAAGSAINAALISEYDSPATDPLPSSTQQKEHKQRETFEYEKGRGAEHESSQEEEREEHGKKAYEGKHEETKTSKGHHDKEDHVGKYDDQGGVDKHHHDESGHYGHHHHEEHGKKHAKYEESGKHSKGHSTKGSHDIHKKEEYEKNVEFFEEDGDFSEEEKHGGHHNEKGHSKGGHFKHGNLKAEHEGGSKDSKGQYSKGGFGNFNKGHKSAEGHDHHGRHGNMNVHKEGKEAGKKWIYHHGHPPRTANLVVIDRRADPYTNVPRYFA